MHVFTVRAKAPTPQITFSGEINATERQRKRAGDASSPGTGTVAAFRAEPGDKRCKVKHHHLHLHTRIINFDIHLHLLSLPSVISILFLSDSNHTHIHD